MSTPHTDLDPTYERARHLPIWTPLIENLYSALSDTYKLKVATFALSLADMTDDELGDACESHIYGSAFWSRRFDVPDHALCDLCANEAHRRDPRDDSVDPPHPGGAIYANAHTAVVRSQEC
jgi:hypothetical protein